MGRRSETAARSQTLPSSPTHSFSSSSSSDFEFTISASPRKGPATLCPADELFYKGQLLPLHLSPRLSMVRTLLLASSSSSSSSNASDPRDSTGSSTDSHSSFSSDLAILGAADCDSSRPSSVADQDDEFKRLNCNSHHNLNSSHQIKKSKYFSLSRFSSVFKKENKNSEVPENIQSSTTSSSVKRMSTTAREVIRKYLKKVKPLYEKLSQQKQQQKMAATASFSVKPERSAREAELLRSVKSGGREENTRRISHSFSGNLRYPRRKSCVSSCPSSMRSSPSHSGVLSRSGMPGTGRIGLGMQQYCSDTSSMEELQSAIQGAIAHCKNSLMQNKTSVSNDI